MLWKVRSDDNDNDNAVVSIDHNFAVFNPQLPTRIQRKLSNRL
jgi:hypothetical protein